MASSPRAHGRSAPSSVQKAKLRIMAVKFWPRTASATAACASWRSTSATCLRSQSCSAGNSAIAAGSVCKQNTSQSRAVPNSRPKPCNSASNRPHDHSVQPRLKKLQDGAGRAERGTHLVNSLGVATQGRRDVACQMAQRSADDLAKPIRGPGSSHQFRRLRCCRSLRLAGSQMPATRRLAFGRDPHWREKLQLDCKLVHRSQAAPFQLQLQLADRLR